MTVINLPGLLSSSQDPFRTDELPLSWDTCIPGVMAQHCRVWQHQPRSALSQGPRARHVPSVTY